MLVLFCSPSITLFAISLPILFGCFISSSTSWYLCFIWPGRYFSVVTRPFLWSNLCFICFLFGQNLLSLSTYVFTPFRSYVALLLLIILILIFHRSFRNFFVFLLIIDLSFLIPTVIKKIQLSSLTHIFMLHTHQIIMFYFF